VAPARRPPSTSPRHTPVAAASPAANAPTTAAAPTDGRRTLDVRRFDLAATLESGQAFHWIRHDGGYLGMIDRTPVWLRQPVADQLEILGAPTAMVTAYLSLDHDLDAITATFPAGDIALARAIAFSPGLRLLRQPAWECLATFITSSLKQVSHISQISHTLRQRFGHPVTFQSHTLHTYPTPEAIADAGETALRACGLGYRARYLASTARLVATNSLTLDFLTDPTIPDDDALKRLTQAPGVGPKVASCVLLFAGQRLGFFPIDVWIARTLHQLYFPQQNPLPPNQLARFAHHHFGPYRGYAQQFLFHHARTANSPRPKKSPKPPKSSP
jgi:N-glycosylase/DNA lyase